MYNIKAYIENLNRKLADIQLKYKEKQQTIDEVATVAMLGLDMVEKKIIREKEILCQVRSAREVGYGFR